MNKSKITSETTHGNLGLEEVLKDLAGGMGPAFVTGNIYYVIKSSESWVDQFVDNFQETYEDGTVAVHEDAGDGLGIQAALDAVTANRDDYVIVVPSSGDYDLTVALTMSKARTHLICPAGLGKKGMGSNAVRLHQNTAATDMITVTADTIEIAGFFFKGGTGNIISFAAATRWHADIHDNFFGMAATDGTENYGVYGTGSCCHFVIHDNYFVNYTPGAVTGTDNDLGSFIYFSSSGCGRNIIRDNLIFSGVNTEVTTAIKMEGDANLIMDNVVMETQAIASSQTGVLTAGITASAGTALVRNVFPGLAASAAIVGPTADLMCIENYQGNNGGTVVDEDT